MNERTSNDYLLLSRGQWDKAASPDQIQAAIDAFYAWLDAHIAAGRMRGGARLTAHGATVSRKGVLTDGPFGETKELIGGYWFIVAGSLDEAAALAAQNPCMQLGLFYEIRPLDAARATAGMRATENASA